jgi:hypothetical protein
MLMEIDVDSRRQQGAREREKDLKCLKLSTQFDLKKLNLGKFNYEYDKYSPAYLVFRPEDD